MKTLVRSMFLAAALVGTASAQSPAPKKAPATEKAPAKAPPADAKKAELPPQDVEKFLAFFNKFVDVVVASKEDCAKLTKDVNALVDANGEMLKKIQEAKAANKDLPQAAKEKMMARVKEMMPAMNKCAADPGFQAAMKRMEGGQSNAATPPPAKTEPAKAPAKTTEPAKTPPAKK